MSEEIASALCKANVVSFGRFKLASGRDSSMYVNLRVLPSYPEVFNFISDKIVELLSNLDVNVVGGTEGGYALATAVSLKTALPAIFVKRPRQFSQWPMIEGVLNKGQKVVLVTDLITNGYNKLRLIEGIKNEGGLIEDIISVVDKEEGAKENLSKAGINLHSLITLRAFLEYMRTHSMIEKERYDDLINELAQDYE